MPFLLRGVVVDGVDEFVDEIGDGRFLPVDWITTTFHQAKPSKQTNNLLKLWENSLRIGVFIVFLPSSRSVVCHLLSFSFFIAFPTCLVVVGFVRCYSSDRAFRAQLLNFCSTDSVLEY